MPLCVWATQTAVAALDLTFTPYLPPHTAATAIQCAYHSYIENEWEWQQKLSWAKNTLKCGMNCAMHDLRDSNAFVFLVCDDYCLHCLTIDKHVGCPREGLFLDKVFLL